MIVAFMPQIAGTAYLLILGDLPPIALPESYSQQLTQAQANLAAASQFPYPPLFNAQIKRESSILNSL